MRGRYIPVAIISSTTKTFWPCFTASACIWKKSSPYSFWNDSVSTRTRQLASLAHRDKASAQSQRKTRSKQEPAGIQADNDIWLLMVCLENVQLKRSDEGFVKGWVGEERQDILEENAWFREIGELTKSRSKSYLRLASSVVRGGWAVACPDSLAVVEASCAVFCWDMLRGSGSTTERRKRGRRVFEGIEKGKENIRGGTEGGRRDSETR